MTRGRRSGGFTLLELLVAMAIFGVIGAMAMGGLNAIVGHETQAREQGERLAHLQRAMRLITTDLGSIQPRYVRDEMGTPGELPLIADGQIEFLLRATRGGWPNPAGLPHRGTLQRVQYRIEEEKLYRDYWPVMEHVLGQEPRTEELLTGVTRIEFLFLDGQNEWQKLWPPLNAAAGRSTRPRAVRITFELEDWGEIERLVEIVP